MFGIYFGTREEIIECADAVPRTPASQKLTDKELLIAREQVFAHADAGPVRFLDVGVLRPLALPNWVEDEHHVA